MSKSAAGHMLKAENCNRLDIHLEEAEQVQSRQRVRKPDGAFKRHICQAAISGNWVEASSYDGTHPNWFCTLVTEDGDTALHIAVSMKQTKFVKKLVERMSMQDMEIPKVDGNNAFCMAVVSGNKEIATILLDKNPGLVWIRGHQDMLPIQLACSRGQLEMVRFLFERIRQDMHIHLSFQDYVTLFFLALTNKSYKVASILLDTYSELASAENEEGLTALEVLAQLSFDPGYQDILSSLFKLLEEEEFLSPTKTSEAMFEAAKSGNDKIVESIFRYNPNMLLRVNSEGQSLLHVAVFHRQMKVFRLILRKGAYKDAIVQVVDSDGNNVLHMAGKLAAEGRFGSPIPQFIIFSEEKWFEEVQKIVPPAFQTMKNREGCTPQDLFYSDHKKFSEKAITSLSEIANNFIVVGTLLVSLGVTAGLTLLTNHLDDNTPFFVKDTWHLMFRLSTVFGLCFTVVSMLNFTSVILPSQWMKKQGYVTARIKRVVYGCLFLYAAVGIMGTFTLSSGAVLVFARSPKWLFYVTGALMAILFFISFGIYGYSFWFALDIILLNLGKLPATRTLSRT